MTSEGAPPAANDDAVDVPSDDPALDDTVVLDANPADGDKVIVNDGPGPDAVIIGEARDEPAPVAAPLRDEEQQGKSAYWVIGTLLALAAVALLIYFLAKDDGDDDKAPKDRQEQVAPAEDDQVDTTPEPAPQPDSTQPNSDPVPDTSTTDPSPAPTSPDTGTSGGSAGGSSGGSSSTQPDSGSTSPSQGSPTLDELAADPESYRGRDFDGQATWDKAVNNGAFLTPEGVLVVAPDALDAAKGDTYTVSGTIGVVDEAFRQRVGDAFFEKQSYDQLAGSAVIEASSVVQQ